MASDSAWDKKRNTLEGQVTAAYILYIWKVSVKRVIGDFFIQSMILYPFHDINLTGISIELTCQQLVSLSLYCHDLYQIHSDNILLWYNKHIKYFPIQFNATPFFRLHGIQGAVCGLLDDEAISRLRSLGSSLRQCSSLPIELKLRFLDLQLKMMTHFWKKINSDIHICVYS